MRIKRKYNRFVKLNLAVPTVMLESFYKVATPFRGANGLGIIYVPKGLVGKSFKVILIPLKEEEDKEEEDKTINVTG